MNISICIPTRDRFELVSEAIESALSNARFPNQIEILLRVDEDDKKFLSQKSSLPYKNNVRIITGPRHSGYRSLDIFHNELARASKGEWLFLLGDDCQITTDAWDEQIMKYSGQLKVLLHAPMWPEDDLNRIFCPILSRKLVDILGHITNHFLFDGYIHGYAQRSGLIGETDIEIYHDAEKGCKSPLRKEINASLEEWRREWGTQDEYIREENIIRDAQAIINYLREKNVEI